MTSYSVCRRFEPRVNLTENVVFAMRMFGLTLESLSEQAITHQCEVKIDAGQVVYITGASGAGKSVLLAELEKKISPERRINLAGIGLPAGRSVIDCMDGDVMEALRLLSMAGLSDVWCLLNQPCHLSDGQKWRFRLAMAMAAGRELIFADEFCSNLDRITASVVSYNVRKFAAKSGRTFILASSAEDILGDLQADVIIKKELSGPARVIYRNS